MSDRKNENMALDAQEQNQKEQTRVMPPVESPSRPPRRRRSERYEDEAAESAQPDRPTEAEAVPVGEPVAPQPETRVMPTQEAASRPIPPRPNVLNRADQAKAQVQAEDGLATRRPMGTPPGFTPRKPLNLDQNDQPRGQLVQRSSTGTGPRIPSSTAGTYARKPVGANDRNGREKRKGRGWLVALVIALLVVGLIVVAIMLLGQNNDGPIGQVRNAVTGLLPGGEEKEPVSTVTASGFTAANNRGTAPLAVMFNLTTSKSIEQVRLADENGNPLSATSAAVTENADSIIWVMNLIMESGYEGVVRAEMFDGTNWIDTGLSQTLEIAMPAPVATMDMAVFSEAVDEPTEAPTEALTEAPVTEPEAEADDEPDEEPVDEPDEEEEPEVAPVLLAEETEAAAAVPTEASEASTPTPTLIISATPTVPSAGTPTPPPAELAVTQVPVGTADATVQPEEDPAEEPLEGEEPEGETPDDGLTEEPAEEPDGQPDAPAATPPLKGVASEAADPSLIRDTVIYNGNNKVDSYTRDRELNMPIADAYITQPYGVLTYRGNAFRQNASVGTVGDVSGMSLLWTAEAGSVKGSSSTYYGIGWTGQPAIIKWSKEVRAATNITADKKDTTALKEVIVAGLDGRIYFLDLADGQPTRDAINLGYPMRGTPSLHPLGYPIMTVGQYARKMANGTGGIGLRFYNLLTQKQDYIIDGLDGKAKRPYNGVGAFDTSALIDPNTDTLVAIGTNGMLYTASLNTEYSVTEEKITVNPSIVSMKSRTKGQADKYTAVQSSPAMYGSYVYYADMQGILRCVDTTTMTTVWAVATGDAVEAAIALDMDENGDLWLYTANTLDNRGKGDCTIRRYNAMTGEEGWSCAVSVAKPKNGTVPGAMASPVIGQYELEDMVYFTLSNLTASGATAVFAEDSAAVSGVLLAIDKSSGEIAWAHDLGAYSYSSPVAVYSAAGKGWIVQAASNGTIMLLDGVTGDVVDTLQVEGTIDASPAVYNDVLVIGTTGKNTAYIYGIKLQ